MNGSFTLRTPLEAPNVPSLNEGTAGAGWVPKITVSSTHLVFKDERPG